MERTLEQRTKFGKFRQTDSVRITLPGEKVKNLGFLIDFFCNSSYIYSPSKLAPKVVLYVHLFHNRGIAKEVEEEVAKQQNSTIC